MEKYTLDQAKNALQDGLISVKEYFLICNLIVATEKAERENDAISEYIRKKYTESVSVAGWEDLTRINQELKNMPECFGKMQVLRLIRSREDKIPYTFQNSNDGTN